MTGNLQANGVQSRQTLFVRYRPWFTLVQGQHSTRATLPQVSHHACPNCFFTSSEEYFPKRKKDCFPAISAENFGFSAAYIFWLSPKSHLFRRVVFLGFSRVGKTLNRYSLPAIHVRRTGSRACCKMVPAFPHLGCTGQKPPRVFHAESLWLPRHSDLSGICRWSDSFFTHNNT